MSMKTQPVVPILPPRSWRFRAAAAAIAWIAPLAVLAQAQPADALAVRQSLGTEAEVTYSDDFQSYGTQKNPAGWIDSSIGNPKPQANGLYKTWPDPLQGNQGSNIAYGTKQASGKPEGSNPRIGTFSTYTAKTFSASGRFEYRGRFIRTDSNARIGLTFLSSYPEQDQYYLIGLWSAADSPDLTMQLFGFGAGAVTGTTNSKVTITANKWYRFVVQVDDAGDATKIRARFWPDGTPEPSTFSIDAADAGATRLKTGRIGMWAADKGAAYIDDIFAKSPVDYTAPVISFFENSVALQPNTLTAIDHDARVDVRAVDDLSGIATLTATADGSPYTPLTPITAEGTHTIQARAVDRVGNASESQTQVLVDKTPPVVQLAEGGTPLPLPLAKFKRPPVIDIAVSDAWTGATYTATLDGQPYTSHTAIISEGTHHLTVDAVDGVNRHTLVQSTILVDLGAPVIEFYAAGIKLASPARFRVDPAIELRLTDAQSAVTYTATLENGQPWRSLDPIPTGSHKITVNAVDEAGNTATASLDVLVDKDAPLVVLRESGTVLDPAQKAKYRRDVAIDIGVTDATSQVQWTATLNGQPYSSGTLITVEQSAHALKVHAADEAGNITDVTLTILLDKSAPVIAFESAGVLLDARDLQEFTRDTAIDIRVTDSVSAATYTATLSTPARNSSGPYVSGTAITVEDTHEVSVSAVDDGGNTAEAKLTILIDKTAPAIAFSESGAPLDTTRETAFARDVRVGISVSDNLPGVTYTARLDGADYVSGAPITADGKHIVAVTATDRAHNVTTSEVKLLVDKSGPVVALLESGVPLDTSARQDFRRLPAIEIRVTDALSSVTFNATLDGVPYTSGTTIPEGTHVLAVRATDALSNVTDIRLDLLADTTAPVVRLEESGTALPATGAIFARDARVAAVIQDVSETTTAAVLDGNPFSLSIPISAEGAHTLQVTVTDELQWTTTIGSTFTIDKTAPKISVFEGTNALLSGASFARDVVLNASAEDITPVQLTARIDGTAYTLGQPFSTNGTHTIVVDAVDAAGNRATPVSILFHLDKNAPEVTLRESGAPFPAGKTFARDIVASATIVAATQTTTVATIDGQPYTLDTPYAPEGRHHLEVKVTNAGGLATTVGADFTIDKTAPSLVLFAAEAKPFTDGMKFAADLTPFTVADDNLTKPPRVVVLLDGQQLAPNTVVSNEKLHTISATATDDGGLTTSVGPFAFVLDKTAPSVVVKVDGQPLEDGQKFNRSITPEITAEDLTATTITARVNDAPYTIGTPIDADGLYTLLVRVKDDLDNESVLPAIHFTIDKTPPVVRILDALDSQPFIGGKFKRAVKPVLEISDLTSTLTNATINDSPWTSGQEISSDGHYTLRVTVTDELGWVTVAPPVDFTIDQTAPVVEITESGTPLVTGTIFNRDARPKIVVTDTTIPLVEATLNGAPYTSETPIAEERKHTLVVKATDELGLVTQVPPLELIVDKTAPVVTVSENGVALADNALLNHDARPIVTVTDLTPVVIVARVDGQPYTLGTGIAAEGPHTFDVTVKDAAGWTTTVPTLHFIVDKTPPVVTVTESGSPLTSGAAFDRTIAPAIQVQDLSATTIAATLNASPWTSGTAIAADGEYVLEVRVTDAAQWTTTLPPIAFVIDKTAPVVRVLEAGVPLETGKKFNRTVQPVVEIVDLTPTTTAATLDGQPWVPGTPIAQDGRHVLAVSVTDRLNHRTVVPPIELVVDQTPPVVTVTEGGQPFVSGTAYQRNVRPEIAVSDATATTIAAQLNGQPYTFGTEIAAEGRHTLTATVTDDLGWTTTIPAIVFFIDRTPPVVTLMEGQKELTSGLFFNRDVQPRAVISDTTATTTTATLLVNGTPQPYVLETPIVDAGTYSLTVKVTDAVGLVTDVPPVSFTIDKTPPAIAFTNPMAEAVVATREVVVTGFADDAVSVIVNGIDAQVVTASKEFVSASPIELFEGANTIVATGVDRAGNNTTISITVHLDARAPEMTITSPAPNACVTGRQMEVTGTVADPYAASVSVTVSPGAAAAVNATLSADRKTWTATLQFPAEGRFVIAATARDSSGHESVATARVRIDETRPVIEITESGAPFTAPFVSRAVTPFVRVSDANPGDEAVQVTSTLDGAAFTSGTLIAGEGSHTIRVVARDCAGNETIREHTFIVDLTPPRFLTFTPPSGAKVSQIPSALGGTTDADAVEVRVSNGAIAAPVSNGAFTIPNIGFAEGLNERTLEVLDRAGHIGRATYTLGIRTTSPLVEITESGDALADGTVFRRVVRPVVRVLDPEVTFTATLDGAPFTSGTAVSANGVYTLSATATDSAYGQTATITRTFTIDRSGPAVTIVTPAEGTTVDLDRIDVRVNATEATTVSVNTVAATRQADGSWLATAIPLDLGENNIVATGRDAAGNSGSDAVSVTRGGAGPALVLTFPPDLYVTNRPRIDVTGRVLRSGSAVSVTVPPATAVSAAVDPAGGFRLTDALLAEGESVIRATATEGGKSVEASARVIADFTPPRVRILESGQPLTEGAGFATQAVLSGEASDKNVAIAFDLLIDGNAVASPTTITAPGGHTVVLTARDAAGNESRIERTFVIGSAGAGGCLLEAFDPPHNAVITAQRVELVGRSGGAAGVKVNGVPATMAGGSFSASVELPQEGANVVTIACTDAAGQAIGDQKTITLIRVTNEPSVTIVSPAEGLVTQSQTLAVSGTLGNGAVSVTVNGKPATIDGSNWTLPNAGLQNGLNVLAARAKNAAGRTAIASRRVLFLEDPPALSITSPVPGYVTGSATVDLSGTWTNVDPTSIVLEGQAGVITTEPWSDTTGRFTAAAVTLQAGNNTLRVTGRDRTGRLAQAEVVVQYVSTLPTITITSPADNHVFGGGQADPFRVSGTFAAAEGSSIDVNGVTATIDTAAKTFFANVSFANVPGGLTPVVAQLAQPAGGSSAFDSIRVLRLAEAPKVLETFPANEALEVDPGVVVLVLFSAPMDRTTTAAAFTLEGASGAPVSGVTVLDKDVLTFAPATTLTPGERYTIRVGAGAKDLAGQPLAAPVANAFLASTTAPAVAPTLTTASGQICTQLADVAGTAAPNARVRIDYGQIFFTTNATSTGAFVYKVPLSGQQGYHVIRVRTIGADGSLSPAAELKLNVDCSGPRVLSAAYDRTVNQLTIVFSTAVKTQSLTTGAAGTIQLVLGNGSYAEGAFTVSGANVTLTPSPTLATSSFTLNVTTGVEDTQNRRLENPYSKLFPFGDEQPQPGDGRGSITGEVYDATTGRPLAGAQITIEVPSTAFSRSPAANSTRSSLPGGPATQAVTMITDARGRYADRFPEGAHTIRASANGYTTVWRQIIVPAGAGVTPVDIRLTRGGDTRSVSSGTLALAHGGNNAVTRRVELTIPTGAAPNGTTVTLTATGSQSLPGLLPLGWSPLASAVISSDATALPNATLSFDVPGAAITSATQTLTAVRYDDARDEWRVLTAAVNVTSNRATFNVAAPGAYALVYSDRRAGLAVPPLPTQGAALQGVTDPCVPTQSSATPCPTMVAKSFPLDPAIVLPTGSTVATLNIEGAEPHRFPSGTAVQAYIDEELRLADGGRELDTPFATDLLLYRDLDGTTGVAAFNLAPSVRAAEVLLEVGFDHIRVVPYPGRLDRGALVGPEGGRVPAGDKVAVEIPTGATPVELRATAASIADPETLGPIAGYTIVAGLQLTLQHVAQPAGEQPEPVELTRPARATFTLGTQHAGLSTLILVELLDQTPFGNRMFRLAAEMTALDATRWTTRSIDRAQLPVDGIIREGRYLLLAPQAPIAFAKGLVRSGPNSVPTASARLTTPSLGVADLTRLTGIFALPVPAAPAAPFTLVPRVVALGDGATYQHGSAPAAGTVVNVGDLTLIAQPPQVLSTIPANHANAVSVTTTVEVTFTPGIDPSSVGPTTLTVIDASSHSTVSGTVIAVGALGIRWTMPSGQALRAGHRYTVAVAPSVRGSNGSPLGLPYTFSFTTASVVTNDEVHPERIRITIPNANGVARIIATAGALKTGWLAVPVRRDRDFVTRYSVTAGADGSFALDTGTDPRDRVSISDEIDLRVLNTNGALVAIVPLTPFVSEDGRSFVSSPRSSVTFTSADGIALTVPAGAFDVPTLIGIAPAAETVFSGVPRFSDELRVAAAVTLTFEGRARIPLELRLTPNTGANLTRPHFLGILGNSVRGPRIMAVDTLYAVSGALTTIKPASGNAVTHRFSTNAQSGSNDPGDYTQGVIEGGQYAALDMRDLAGSNGMVWAFMDGLTAVVELLFDALHSMYVSAHYISESHGRITFPIPSGVQFKITGLDPSTSLIDFEQTYSALPVGDPGTGTVIPNPATDFAGPRPVFGTPFRIETVSAPPPGLSLEPTSGVRLTLSDTGVLSLERVAPLTPSTKISVLHVPTGTLGSGAPISGVKQGDELVVMIEETKVDPATPLSIVFNEAIDLGATNATDRQAISDYLATIIKLERVPTAGGSPIDLLGNAFLLLDSGNRRVTILLPSPLPAGADLRLTLDGDIQDVSGNGLGLGQAGAPDNSGSIKPIGSRHDIVMRFSTREPAGTLGEFDIRQSSSQQSGQIRELVQHDNLMFVAALDGGILAYDLSDSAALDDSATTKPTPVGQAPAGITDYWSVQVDRHGRVYGAGTTTLFGVLRTFRVEDFVNAKADPNDDCMPSVSNAVCRIVGATAVSQTPGSSSTMGIASAMVVTDRVEAIPRRVKVVVGDEAPEAITRQVLIDTYANGAGTPLNPVVGAAGLVLIQPKIPASTQTYRLQRITIENKTLGLRWSADAKGTVGSPVLAPAEFKNVIAGPNDQLEITRNLTTHAVVTLFGYGIGIYDMNAVESNDYPLQVAGSFKSREQVATQAGLDNAGGLSQTRIDIKYSGESQIVGLPGDALRTYSLDSRKGVIEHDVLLPSAIAAGGEMLLNASNPRFAAIDAAVRANNPAAWARFNSSALYRNANTGRTYLLLPAIDYGLLVAEAGSTPLTIDSLADAVWLPDGAYAVRVIERSNQAVILDGRGYAHLLDLSGLDERDLTATSGELFPTAAVSIPANTLDPRILWTSDVPVAQGTGFIPPLVDPDTGMMISADLLSRRVRVGSVMDPKIRIVADLGAAGGPQAVGSIVPLGIDPPKNITLLGPNASLGVFRVEATLPGSMQESSGAPLHVAVESERVPGIDAPQTPLPYPRAHLRSTKRDGSADPRPTADLTLRRVLDVPSVPELRYQRGWNRFASDWIVAIADPRAAKDYGTPPADCPSCTRPAYLASAGVVHELYTGGRFIAVRPEALSGGYAFLAANRRMTARVTTTPADTVRPVEALVAAQNPPAAEGMLQDTTYLHSGEVETSGIDIDAGGRAGWNVLVDRTYRSRTVGLTPFGNGWDSALFRRLRALPNGDVEYRDGAEVWRFKVGAGEYVAPKGLFLKLARQNSGWTLIDQKFRITRFDDYGRLVSESDQFHQPREKDSGNLVVYLYGADGSLTHIVDPVGRASTVTYRPDGLVQRITDWHAAPRTLDYDYTAAALTKVELVAVATSSGGRPTVSYAYEPAGSGYKAQLELATNLSTVTEPGIATPRVDFTYDASNDRVTSQKWATNETASFTYALPTSATVTDVLGQTRTYTLTGANSAIDLTADRAHASSIAEQVETWNGAAAGELPSAISPTPPAVATVTRTRQFGYENGALKSSEIAGLRKTDLGWEAQSGTPGLLMKSQTTSPSGGGSSAVSFLPPSAPISRTFHYQASGAFLQALAANGKRIESPEPHRDLKEPTADNDSINEKETFSKNGQLTAVDSSGGLDPSSAGSTATITYWPDSAAKHMRGRPQTSRDGSLETTYEYPSESRIVVTDPRKVETTTDFDTWNRPTKVTVTKPGDPLVLTETYTYDASGRARTIVQGRSSGDVTTTLDYDVLGRQIRTSVNQIATVGSMETTTVHNLAARTTITTSPGGATTTVQLDALGRVKRSVTTTGDSPIEQHFAYDLAGNGVFATDLLTATASAYDVHGRAVGTMHADGTITTTAYDEWSRPINVKSLADDATQIVGESSFAFTPAGRMTSSTTRVDGAAQRTSSFVWDGGGRTTGVATSGRASRSTFDPAGRVLQSLAGAGNPLAITDLFSKSEFGAHDGWLPQLSTSSEIGGSSYTSTAKHDTTGNTTESSVGPLTWTQNYDQLGSVTSATEPGRPATTYKTDARGAVETETLPDGAVNQYAYHDSGAQASYTDPANEPTSTINDLLGRPTRRNYADGTSEVIEYEGSRVQAVTDRQARKQTYSYNNKGQLEEARLDGTTVLDRLGYDNAGRLISWKNADSEVTWSNFDLEGRPKTTSQKRFRNASGLSASPDLLDQFEQTHTYNEHGERTGFTMPAYPGLTFAPGWTSAVQLGYDAMGNLSEVSRGGTPLMTATYRNAGRPDTRTVTTAAGATITRGYGYDPATSQLNRMTVSAGGVTVAGSAVEHDGLQLSSAQLLGVSSGQRTMQWRYDVRSRVIASSAGVPATTDPIAPVPGRAKEVLSAADFRTEQARISRFDATTAATLQSKGIDTAAIDPPTATFAEQPGHKIAEVAKGPQVRPFGWNGAERVDDGRFVYEFDAKGRLLRATEKGTVAPLRRILYTYSGPGRVVGRRAEYTTISSPTPADWKLEDRNQILIAEGRPADTTFVWDPISDNLLAVFKTAPVSTDPNGGLLKQILHGGAAYDDPLETTTANPNGTVAHLYPVYDEAGAGSLQVVLNEAGAVVARTLPNDPYGGENIDFRGAAIDRVAIDFRKSSSGTLEGVDVAIHATEQLEPASLATGVRLAAVESDGDLVRSAPGAATLDPADPFTARWSLTPAEWTTLTNPAAVVLSGETRTPTSLSVAATETLRAATWSPNTPILPAPTWAVATLPVYNDRYPVEIRTALSSLASTTGSTLYAVEDLSLLGTSGSDTIIEDIAAARFHALPFAEPATGLVYARARWYDPSTGSFLSPDPMGYRDSSNLYSFGAGDPVNRRDPTGNCSDPWDSKCWQNWYWAGGFFVEGLKNPIQNAKRGLGGLLGTGRLAAKATVAPVVGPTQWMLDDIRAAEGDPVAIQRQQARDEKIVSYIEHPLNTATSDIVAAHSEASSRILEHEKRGQFVLSGAEAGELGAADFFALYGVAQFGRQVMRRVGPAGIAMSGEVGALFPSKAQILRDNLKAIGVKPPPFPNAAHHIVAADAALAQPARVHLDRLGIGVNDAANGVFLRYTEQGAGANHAGLHTQKYYTEVNRRVLQATTAAEARFVLIDIADELIRGVFPY